MCLNLDYQYNHRKTIRFFYSEIYLAEIEIGENLVVAFESQIMWISFQIARQFGLEEFCFHHQRLRIKVNKCQEHCKFSEQQLKNYTRLSPLQFRRLTSAVIALQSCHLHVFYKISSLKRLHSNSLQLFAVKQLKHLIIWININEY